jgi:multidrug efflux system outer membrane protein
MVGPDYSRPTTAAGTSSAFVWAGEHNQDVNDIDSIDSWWQGFGDPTTADLVRQALENNYDIKAAAARVLQAQAALAEARGRRLPDVSYGINRDRSKRSFTFGSGAFGGGGRLSIMSTTWSQDISIAYILDLFGRLKRTQRAAWADMFAAQAAEQALINSIIATVVTARIDIATLQKRLAIAKANIQSRQDTLQIVERRYRRGVGAAVEVRLARENLEAAKVLEPSIELQPRPIMPSMSFSAKDPANRNTCLGLWPSCQTWTPSPLESQRHFSTADLTSRLLNFPCARQTNGLGSA